MLSLTKSDRWLQDNVIGVVETRHVSKLAQVQMAALQAGRDSSLKFKYDGKDELCGAFCDSQWFSKADLEALSSLH